MELHERIYQLRKEKNMTQQDLADIMGVSRQAVSRWEMGTARPDIDSLIGISQAFGVTLDELVTGLKSQPLPAEPKPDHTPRPDKRKWVLAWLFTWLGFVVVALIWLFIQWKLMDVLLAISPVALVVQFVNIGFDLGIGFFIAYWIRKWLKK